MSVAFMMPGQAAVLSLDDKFFYLALAMIVTALVAASQWDALAIDSRDAAILEPLPVPAGTIRRAKVSAVAIMGAAWRSRSTDFRAASFRGCWSFAFPQMRAWQLFALMAAHAIVTVTAAMFGYLVDHRAARKMVGAARAALVRARVALGAGRADRGARQRAAAAADRRRSRSAQRGFDGWRASSPPMWFLGVYEIAIGGDRRQPAARRRSTAEEGGRRSRDQRAVRERRRAVSGAGAARGCRLRRDVRRSGVIAYLWNARRPAVAGAAAAAVASPALADSAAWLAKTILARDRTARAGFDFTLAAMWRSNTHRLTLACAPPRPALRMAVLALSNANAQQGGGPSSRLLVDAAAAVRRAAGRLSSHHPRAGGAARELGLPAGVARPRARVRLPASSAPPIVALVLPVARNPASAVRVRARSRARRSLHAALDWPAPSCCSKR